VIIRPAAPDDYAGIHAAVEAAFGQPDEADLIDRLRADGDALVELVAEVSGQIVGHILFSPMQAEPAARFAALAPLAVIPGLQKDGIGSALGFAGIEACRMAGVEAVIVLGHPAYYPRFGFSAEAAKSVKAPFSGPSFMALALRPGALDKPHTVRYAPAFGL
jgi:putative acetyltransferase